MKRFAATCAAAALTVIAFMVGVGAPLAGQLSDSRGERWTAILGFVVTAIGLLVLGIPGAPLEGAGALALLLPFGVGIGLLFAPA